MRQVWEFLKGQEFGVFFIQLKLDQKNTVICTVLRDCTVHGKNKENTVIGTVL